MAPASSRKRPKLDIDSLLSEKVNVDKARKERAEKAAVVAQQAAKEIPLKPLVTAADTGEGNDVASPNNARDEETQGQGKQVDSTVKAGRDSKRRTGEDEAPIGWRKPRAGMGGATGTTAATTAGKGRRTGRGRKQDNDVESSEFRKPSGQEICGTVGREGDDALPRADVDGGRGIGEELARALMPTDEVEMYIREQWGDEDLPSLALSDATGFPSVFTHPPDLSALNAQTAAGPSPPLSSPSSITSLPSSSFHQLLSGGMLPFLLLRQQQQQKQQQLQQEQEQVQQQQREQQQLQQTSQAGRDAPCSQTVRKLFVTMMSADTPLDAAACDLLTHLSLQPPAHQPSDAPSGPAPTELARAADRIGRSLTAWGREENYLTGNMAAAFAAPGMLGWEGQQRERPQCATHHRGSQHRRGGSEGGSGERSASTTHVEGDLLPRLILPDWLPGRREFEAALVALGMPSHLLHQDEECVRQAEGGQIEGEGGQGEERTAAAESAIEGLVKQQEGEGGQGRLTVDGESRREGDSDKATVPRRLTGGRLVGGSTKGEQLLANDRSTRGVQSGGEGTGPAVLPEELASVEAGADATAAVLGWQQRKAHLLLQLLRARCLGHLLHSLGERQHPVALSPHNARVLFLHILRLLSPSPSSLPLHLPAQRTLSCLIPLLGIHQPDAPAPDAPAPGAGRSEGITCGAFAHGLVRALSCTGACACPLPQPHPTAGKAVIDLTEPETTAKAEAQEKCMQHAAAGSPLNGPGHTASGADSAVNAVNSVSPVNAAALCSDSSAVSASGSCSLSSAAAFVLRLPGQQVGRGGGGADATAEGQLRSAAAAALVLKMQSIVPPPSQPPHPPPTDPSCSEHMTSDIDLNHVIDRFVSSPASNLSSLSSSSSDLHLLLLTMCLMDASLAPGLAQLSPSSLQRWMAWLSSTRRSSSAEKRMAAHPVRHWAAFLEHKYSALTPVHILNE